MTMEIERVPSLGSKPVKLSVSMPAPKIKESLAEELRELFQKGLCCDAVLVCADTKFPCHRTVLAARSPTFRDLFATTAPPEGAAPAEPAEPALNAGMTEVRISCANNPEAVQMMLDHIYESDASGWKDYSPGTQSINTDVLRLAQVYQLPNLGLRAAHWLSRDVTTGDVVERLAVCRDFGLEALRTKMLEQLLTNKAALSEVAHGAQIMQYPELMQALLQQAAGKAEEEQEDTEPAPKKKAKKGSGKGGR